MSLIQPKHDPFFSLSLENPAIAYDFFKHHVPAYIAENLDLENIGRIDRKHTATELNQRERDIIYKTTLGLTGTAFICIEHQSQEQWQMPLRLLQYHLDTTRMYLNAGNKRWPLVISLLFHQGPRSPYPYASQLTDYYEDPKLGDQQLFFRFYIIDITQMSDKQILAHGLCAPVELLLKHARDGKFELSIEEYREVFHQCIEEVGNEYIFAMLSYAKDLSDIEVGKRMYEFIEQVFTDKQELIMTYGQILKQEGIQEGLIRGVKEGIQQGMQQGIETRNIEVAKNMLSQGLDINLIQKVTGLSLDTIKDLAQ